MNEKEEHLHVIEILEKTKSAVLSNDVLKLDELSNQTIHSASVEQDSSSIAIAVIVYSLSKIIERRQNENFKGCDAFCKSVLTLFDKAIKSSKSDDKIGFTLSLNEINSSINKLSPDAKSYVRDVFNKARINKASKIYEHGISMEQTAKLLGVTLYELSSYAGQKSFVHEEYNKGVSIKERIKLAEEIFG